MKNLCLSKDCRKRVKRQAKALRGCLQYMYLLRILQVCKKHTDRLVWGKHYNEKWVNDLNRHFTEAGIQMASTHMKRNLIQLCLTLCDPMIQWMLSGRAPAMRILIAKNTGVICHALFQGIFPTQELNFQTQRSILCLLHCRQTLYHLGY